MEITVLTENPQQLIEAIEIAIKFGTLKKWGIVNDSSLKLYLTHTQKEWFNKVLIESIISNDNTGSRVKFKFHYYKNSLTQTGNDNGFVRGQFIETLIYHFNDKFTILNTY